MVDAVEQNEHKACAHNYISSRETYPLTDDSPCNTTAVEISSDPTVLNRTSSGNMTEQD